REPENRFQTASEMLEALEAVAPPAPPRELAAYVKLRCGARMSERRIRLRSLLDGRTAPLTLTPVPPPDSKVATQGSLASTVAPARRRAGGSASADTDIPVAEGTMVTAAGRSRGWTIWLALVAASFLIVAAGVAWKTRATRAPAASSSNAPAPTEEANAP